MSTRAMNTLSYWRDTQSLPRFSALDRDLQVDVVIVGAGITGITTAYLLKRAGFSVALLERDRCGGVDTSYTSGHLTYVTDLRLNQLVRRFGDNHAQAVWEAGSAALDRIAANVSGEEIDCDFKWVPAYLYASLSVQPQEVASLREDASLARSLGFGAAFLDEVPYFAAPGVQFPHQARIHPLKYLRALLKAIPGDGCHVFEHTEADAFAKDPLAVIARGHRLQCHRLVLATHTPLVGEAGPVGATFLQSKLSHYTTYVLGARLPAGEAPEALYWDTAEPYHYLRVESHRGHDYAIFGGEDHKTGQEKHTTAAYERLEKKLATWIPRAELDHRWSGQVIETNDGLPYIGPVDERQFVATGFGGNGLTFGTLSAMMATDAFLGRRNPWAELFSPHRTKLVGGTWNYLKENKDYPYYLVRNWVAEAEGTSLGDLPRGQGKILNLDGHKVAAYRDPEGKVTLCSPVCSHLKCIVGWNEAESTWDCPCHGSRFKPTGEVMSGPAQAPLEPVKQS
jgi:glycine/D-amino acid oxidase-like deaminating enzyme/nitrite reductase/ring-hydroxylating ferredoxin subunit